MKREFHGVGLSMWGERDYWPDGSFISTEWFVLGHFPIAPLASKRVSYTRNSQYAVYDGEEYYVYETTSPNRKQVLSVYGWLAALVLPLLIYSHYQGILARRLGSDDWAAAVFLATFVIVLITPLLLRRLAKRRLNKACELVKLGQDPGQRYSFLIQNRNNIPFR